MKLTGIVLRNGEIAYRPEGQLGTCGWHPKPWTVVIVEPGDDVVDKFLSVNKNWTKDDLELWPQNLADSPYLVKEH